MKITILALSCSILVILLTLALTIGASSIRWLVLNNYQDIPQKTPFHYTPHSLTTKDLLIRYLFLIIARHGLITRCGLIACRGLIERSNRPTLRCEMKDICRAFIPLDCHAPEQ